MREEELLEICKERSRGRRLFWSAEIYGFGHVIRKFGYYPGKFPLNIYLAHGLTTNEHPAPHELENGAPVMFYFSPRLVKAFKEVSRKPCFCLISPNVFYRRSNKISLNSDRSGTIAFLAHTTPLIEDKMDFASYISKLQGLPSLYHPITICLHYHDVNKGVHKYFYDAGFDVVTVGRPDRTDYIERFYGILRQFKFATSNEVGSYTFYCAEFGIPFFVYGDEPEFYNHADENIEKGHYSSYKTKHYYKLRSLFSKPVDNVTAEQVLFVEEELGVNGTITRLKMASLLYWSLCLFVGKRMFERIVKGLKVRSNEIAQK
jgi:hypothetical protein